MGLAHLMLRVFREQGCFSRPTQAWKSIIAGVRRGVYFGRFYLYNILETVHHQYHLAVSTTRVDDITQYAVGSAKFLSQALAKAGILLGRLCNKAHLSIASKSKVISGDIGLAREIAQKIAQHNINHSGPSSSGLSH